MPDVNKYVLITLFLRNTYSQMFAYWLINKLDLNISFQTDTILVRAFYVCQTTAIVTYYFLKIHISQEPIKTFKII